MRQAPRVFLGWLLFGLLPLAVQFVPDIPWFGWMSGAWVPTTWALVAVLAYAIRAYRLAAERAATSDESIGELSDSVYFLGFLLTMGVLGGAFLSPASADDTKALQSAVGQGVLLTLVGLAARVIISLSFGGQNESGVTITGVADLVAKAAAGTPPTTPAAPIASPIGAGQSQVRMPAQPMLSEEQLRRLEESIANVESSAQKIGKSYAAVGKTLKGLDTALDEWNDPTGRIDKRMNDMIAQLKERANGWVREMGEIDHLVHTSTDRSKAVIEDSLQSSEAVMKRALEAIASVFESGATEFRASIDVSRQAVLDRRKELDAEVETSLLTMKNARERIARLVEQEQVDLTQVAAAIRTLSIEVRDRTAEIPNPADVMLRSMQQVVATATATSEALATTGRVARESAKSLEAVTAASEDVPKSLRSLERGIVEEAEQLRKEVKAIDGLLEQFADLTRKRLDGTRK